MTTTYVIAGKCLEMGPQCDKCVMYCPTEAIHGGENYAYIDPDYCIECGACMDICKEGVIIATEPIFVQGHWRTFLPMKKEEIVQRNVELAEKHRN